MSTLRIVLPRLLRDSCALEIAEDSFTPCARHTDGCFSVTQHDRIPYRHPVQTVSDMKGASVCRHPIVTVIGRTKAGINLHCADADPDDNPTHTEASATAN